MSKKFKTKVEFSDFAQTCVKKWRKKTGFGKQPLQHVKCLKCPFKCDTNLELQKHMSEEHRILKMKEPVESKKQTSPLQETVTPGRRSRRQVKSGKRKWDEVMDT